MMHKITKRRQPLATLLILIALVLILSSCTINKPQSTKKFYQQNTLTKCINSLPRIENNSPLAIQNALIQWRNIYIDCALRHNTLVETIIEVNNENYIIH